MRPSRGNRVSGKSVGARVLRSEDERLLRGAGEFVDDIRLPGMLYAAFLRSPHAHALIKSIKTDAALELDGVAVARVVVEIGRAHV